jgi:acyl dehydratase
MKSGKRRLYSDLVLGEVIDSPAITVTETHVVLFSGLAGDFHPIHTNVEYASKTQFGARLAHGPLVFSLSMGLLLQANPLDSIAFLGMDWNIVAPVRIGDTIFLRTTLEKSRLTSAGDKAVIEHRCEVINQNDQIVQKGITKILMPVN